jgi:catechol 2,3-dioxygenase-like lactoylglutathione lyase family enzyme
MAEAHAARGLTSEVTNAMTSKKKFTLTGVEQIRFAVERLDDARRFASDWGLADAGSVDGAFLYRTRDGSEVEIVAADPSRPGRTPIGAASGICEITWGAADDASMSAIADELSRDREVSIDATGMLRSVDDLGIGIAFRRRQRTTVPFDVLPFNAPGQARRIDHRAPRYERATPHEISHIAINVNHAGEACRFYTERLGFHVSDRYAERGVFMRCAASGNHHHLFLMNGREPGIKFNHLAFKVRDVHEVIAGGQYIDAKGWVTFAGPGRHLISSANFWYFLSPFGGSWEYAADEDMVTEAWQPQDFAAVAHIFSEWTFGLEKSDGTLRGPISHSAARREP